MKQIFVIFTMVFVVAAVRVGAQDTENTCANSVSESILQTLPSCVGLERDYACYGAVNGRATLFTTAADNAIPLTDIQTIETAPLDITAGSYGVALMNTSANFPRSLAGPGAMFLLLGSTRVENAVPPDSAFTPATPVMVTTLSSVNLRIRPSQYDTILYSINPGVTLPADGVSGDGEWYRVVYEDTPVWAHASLIGGQGLAGLPVIDAEQRALMQDFYLTTDESGDNCGGAINALVIQGLKDQTVRLTVNGAEIYALSTIALRSITRPYSEFVNDPNWRAPDTTEVASDDTLCQFLQLMAIDGLIYLNDYRFSASRGYQVYSFSCTEGETPVWDRVEPISPDDLDRFRVLENLPAGVLRYAIHVPTSEEVAQIGAQLALATVDTPPTSTPTSIPAALGATLSPTPATMPDPSDLCAGFRPTHPIDGVAFGNVRFYWDPTPYATSYRVNLYNYLMELIVSEEGPGPYSMRVNTTNSSLGDGTLTSWIYFELLALRDGEVICTAPLLHVQRGWEPHHNCPPELWYPDRCPDDEIVDDP